MKQYRVGSLFAGIGGIDIAFEQAGYDVLWANEYDKYACDTFRHNFKHTKMFELDINKFSTNDAEGIDVITSGFPCQAFSIAGYRQGFNDEKGRGNLFFETARFIDELKPKAFLLENVKNLAGHDKGNTIKVIRNTIINDLGYSFIPFILNSKVYGNIPQTRERIYIVGFKDEADLNHTQNEIFKTESIRNACTPNFKIPDPIPLTQTIHDIIDHKKHDEKYYYHKDHRYYKELTETMKNEDTIYQWRRVYVRENKSNVCPTLTANMGTGGHNVPLIIDKYGIRKLTPKECIGFQGFPKEFNFPENMSNSHRYKQAGNSVVIPVMSRVANAIRDALDSKYS